MTASGLLGLLLALSNAALAAEAELVRRSFREVDTLFANPGQGWMSQQRRPRGELRFPYSAAYVRFDWAEAEPEESRFNWDLIDNAIAAWKPCGATVALRVMTCNAHSGGYHTSPKWLFDAGCKGHEYLRGGDDPTSGGRPIPRIEPDYADPIYLEKHGTFLRALGARYDGHPDVAFLDVGSYGIWGEWHTEHPAPVSVRQQIVDLYLHAFRKTPLVFMSDDADVLTYALAHGTGLRRDGVGSPWHEQNWIGSKKYAGVVGSITGISSVPLAISEIGDGRQGRVLALQTSRTLCRVFNWDNLEPNVETHPRIEDVVYWGMSWNVPRYDQPLHDQLKAHYGRIHAAAVIRDILPAVRTGSLQATVYDLTDLKVWTANAKAEGKSGPLNAYERDFVELDMRAVFKRAEALAKQADRP